MPHTLSADPMETVWRNPVIRLLLACLAFVLAAMVCGTAFPFHTAGGAPRFLVADDSMITLRVAYNFAHHLGPYFNAGERTAANTSLFWPILLSPIYRIVPDAARAVAILSVLSTLCASATIALVVFFCRRLASALTTGATLLLLPGLAAYGSSAWEHVPQTLLVTLAFQVFLGWIPRVRERDRTGVCLLLLSAAFLLRPDSLPLAVAVIAGALLLRSRWAPLDVAGCAVLAGSVVGYFALHHHLYDSFVPNTFYLKVRFGAASLRLGARYIVTSTVQSAIPMFVLALAILALRYRGAAVFTVHERIVIGALVLQTVYIALVGGDVFLYGRFFLLLGPTAVALLWEKFWAFEHGGQRPQARAVFAAAGATVVVTALSITGVHLGQSLGNFVTFLNGQASPDVQPYADQAVLADYIRARVSPADGQVGLFALGALAYYLPEYTVADFLGKADPVIAHEPVRWGPIGHNKWDFVHTLRDRNVSVVPFVKSDDASARERAAAHADFAFTAAFQLDPYLLAHYTYRSAAELGSPGTQGLFIRNDLLPRFTPAAAAPLR